MPNLTVPGLIVLAFLVAAVPSESRSAVVVELEAKAGGMAYGSSGTWDENNAAMDLQVPIGDPGAIALEVTPNADPALWWRMSLVGPDGQFPGPGKYPVERYPFQATGYAGGDIGNFLGCNKGHGSVEVHEVEYMVDGTIGRIAADLTYACTNSIVFSVAKLRINSSIPFDQPAAHAVVASEQVVTPGDTVALDGSASYSDNASITTYSWRQLEGEPVTIAGTTSPIATFTFPQDKGAFQEMLFELSVTDDMGRSDSAQATIVAGAAQTPDTVHIFERGNNYVWRQEVSGLGPNPPVPYAISGSPLDGLLIESSTWLFDIEAPLYDRLRIGGYTSAQRNGPISMFPGLTLANCNYGPSDDIPIESFFDVLDASFAEDDSVQRFGFDFFVRCEVGNRNTYEGQVRFGSYAPLDFGYPRALAGVDTMLYAGESGFLNGIRSRAPDNSIREFRWTQISGPAVAIEDAGSAITRVIAPDTIGQETTVAVRLEVTDATGRTSSDVVNLTVVPTSAPRTFMHLQGDASTFIGKGETAYLRDGQDTSLQSIARVLGDAPNSRDEVTLRDEDARSWFFRVITGTDGMLYTGYTTDTANGQAIPVLPELSIANSGRACNRATGTMQVLEATRGADSVINSLAIDFEQTCQFETGSLRGSVRLNSTVPNSYPIIVADAGPDRVVLEGDTVELFDASGSDVLSHWIQVFGPETKLSDANSKRASFVPPTIPAGESRHFAFRLVNQRSDGAVGEDYVVIRVDDNGRTDWDAADFDKYVDKPQAYISSRGQRFGFRQTNPLGNLASVAFGAESVLGLKLGNLEVVQEIFPVTDFVYRGVGTPIIEYFMQGAIPEDYKVILKDVNGQWQLEEGLSTGDGLFQENGWTRVRTTTNMQGMTGIEYDQDALDQSATMTIGLVRLGAPGSAPTPSGNSGGGGGSVAWYLLVLLLMTLGFRMISNRRPGPCRPGNVD